MEWQYLDDSFNEEAAEICGGPGRASRPAAAARRLLPQRARR